MLGWHAAVLAVLLAQGSEHLIAIACSGHRVRAYAFRADSQRMIPIRTDLVTLLGRADRPTNHGSKNAIRYARGAGFKGKNFVSLEQAREWMSRWARDEAGNRIHGTISRRPKEHFELEERHLLLPAVKSGYDVPIYGHAKVGRDHQISVAKALYSVRGEHIGQTLQVVRGDRTLVKVFWRGQLIETHPRKQPCGRSTDPADYPQHKRVPAMRDINYLRHVALSHGVGVGSYAARLLNSPLPWTRMRQVYKLLGVVHRYVPERVNDACGRSLDLDVVEVYRMVTRHPLVFALDVDAVHQITPARARA